MKGTMYVTDDINMVLNNVMNYNIIAISEDAANDPEFINSTNASIATVLLPPPQLLALEMEGNIDEFKRGYFDYLYRGEAFEFITIILKVLYNGNNVMIYLSPSESKLHYMPAFMEFMYNNYGVMIGSSQGDYFIDYSLYHNILNTLYMNNLITGMEYLLQYPTGVPIVDPNTISKLAIEVNPYIGEDRSIEAYTNFFNGYKERLKVHGEMSCAMQGI